MNTVVAPTFRPEEFKPTPSRPPKKRGFVPWMQVVAILVVGVSAAVLWFLFTSKAVRLVPNVPDAEVEVSGGLIIPTPERFLMRPGTYEAKAIAEGYHELTAPITVTREGDQTFSLVLEKLPGDVSITSTPDGAEVSVDGQPLGQTPIHAPIPAGLSVFEFSAPRYIAKSIEQEIWGMHQEQFISVELNPDWAVVTAPSEPSGASIFVDGIDSGVVSPGPVEILSGEHSISWRKAGYATWTDILYVEAGQTRTLDLVQLERQDGLLTVRTEPTGASVSIDGEFQGTTPLTAPIKPSSTRSIEVLLVGYKRQVHNVNVEPGEEQTLDLDLEEVTGTLVVTTEPEGVEVWVDGKMLGQSNDSFVLHAVEHSVELRKEGYAGYSNHITIQPGFPQALRVRLLTLEEARLEALRRVRNAPDGQEIVLLHPETIRMGASRRQPGRRANEVFRTAKQNRLFYMGIREVTNAQFREFVSGHDSGTYYGNSLNKEDQPVVNVSWTEAALYCNHLSELEGLEPFYLLQGAKVVGFNPNALGYRLPSESEWSWAARHVDGQEELLHFPWGEGLPPPSMHGNYADRAAQHIVSRVLFDYNDNYPVTAPVGQFDPNSKGLLDMGGNVAEWMHDFYSTPEAESTVSVLGPTDGEYHVIRGSSFLHGTVTDVRLSFRDYGTDGRQDVGFRIARYAE